MMKEKIERCMKSGYVPVAAIGNKKLCIDSYSIQDKGIDFVLKSELGEYLNFTCVKEKLSEFLANFPITANESESTLSVDVENKKRNIQTIRDVLFDSLLGLKSGNMDVGTAKAIALTAQALINSVKIEMEYKVKESKSHFNIKMLD